MTRAAMEREPMFLAGPVGRLEALRECRRGGEPRAVAVVCHPHPLYGGSLDNKVTFTLARAAVEAGAETLRFNFRGVGRSEGTHDAGRGELEDLHAAERWLSVRRPGLPLWRLGFSFGAAMVLRASLDSDCAALVTVAPPAERFAEYGLAAAAPNAGRWLLVQGDADEVVDPRAVSDWAGRLSPGPELAVLEGAGHFFHGRLTELRQKVLEFLRDATGEDEAG